MTRWVRGIAVVATASVVWLSFVSSALALGRPPLPGEYFDTWSELNALTTAELATMQIQVRTWKSAVGPLLLVPVGDTSNPADLRSGSELEASTYSVSIDASEVADESGALEFVVTSPSALESAVDIVHFDFNGDRLDLIDTSGRVYGDLVGVRNPAEHTSVGTGPDSGYGSLYLRLPKFGTRIDFKLRLVGRRAAPQGGIPDQFALYVFDRNRRTFFETGDPLGTNSLFAIDFDGSAAGRPMVFAPATYDPAERRIVLKIPASDLP